jgi:hypothetical protein
MSSPVICPPRVDGPVIWPPQPMRVEGPNLWPWRPLRVDRAMGAVAALWFQNADMRVEGSNT